jgi:hypothetical protein
MMADYVGRRFRAVVALGAPLPDIAVGEEFTVTPDMVVTVPTQMGPMTLVDFGSLLYTGAIEAVAPAPKPRPASAPPDAPAGGG